MDNMKNTNENKKKPDIAVEALQIGRNEQKNKPVFIKDENRMQNLLFIGKKGLGKTTKMLPFLAKQDFINKKVGATFIVSGKDSAMYLYALAKKQKRQQIVLLKPNLSTKADKLFELSQYDELFIRKFVLDYEKAIRHKKIVIIDLEVLKNSNRAIQLTAYLLESLKQAMLETKDVRHNLYVDDAEWYMPYLEMILSHGKEYGVTTTLFLQSRNSVERHSGMLSVLDDTVRNIVVTASLQPEDFRHYEMVFHGRFTTNIPSRSYKEFEYSTFNENRILVGKGEFDFFDEEEDAMISKSAKIHAGKLEKEYKKEKQKTFPFTTTSKKDAEEPSKELFKENLQSEVKEPVTDSASIVNIPERTQKVSKPVKSVTSSVDKKVKDNKRFIPLSNNDDDYVF